MTHWSYQIVLVAVICVMLVSCTPFSFEPKSGDDRPTAKIVSSLVRTGSANAQTSHIVRGIRLALKEAKDAAGPFRLIYEDWDDASSRRGDWDPEVEANNAALAAADPQVLAYLGPYNSGAAKIALPILNRAGLINISPSVSYSGLTREGLGEMGEPGVYRPSGRVTFFRVVPSDDVQGRIGAQWMKTLGAKRVFVLDDLQLYGKGVADVFAAHAQKIGMTVLGHESIDPKAPEYRSVMVKLRALRPDWIYFGGTTQTGAGQLIKDMVAMGVPAKMMMPDGCFEEAMIEAAGAENAEGRVYLTFGGVPPEAATGKGRQFVEHYAETYRHAPDAYAIYGYVAAKVAIEAIGRAGRLNREAVRQSLFALEQKDGPLGSWSFGPSGDLSQATLSGSDIRGGAFHFLTLLDLETSESSR